MAKTFQITLGKTPEEAVTAAKANQLGIVFSGDTSSGTLSGMGIAGSYAINDSEITVIIEEKPFLIGWDMIEGQLKQFFG